MQQAIDAPVVVRLHGPKFLNAAALGTATGDEFQRVVEAERVCITEAVGVTSPSREVLERTRQHYGLPLSDARVIHYPGPIIPAERQWTYENCDKKSILFVGGFDRHKGYSTAEHFAAIARYGVTPHHRRSFRPVQLALGLV